MALNYIFSSHLNNAARGVISLYLMQMMGAAETGRLSADMAPYIFISMLITAFSAECFIRGSRRRVSGYRDRVVSLLIDAAYLSAGVAYLFFQKFILSVGGYEILISMIIAASAFGQISMNHLLDRKAWTYLTVANTAEIVVHLGLMATVLKGDPVAQFVLLAFSRWFFLNILNVIYLLRHGGGVGNMYARWRRYKARFAWVIPSVRVDHLGNLGLKTLWTTMDVYLINAYWTSVDAGGYRFIKALGGWPAMLIAPMWTAYRGRILNEWVANPGGMFNRFKTIVRLALYFSAPLPFVIFMVDALNDHLGQFASLSHNFTVGGLVGFSMWWLTVSVFGWVRYFMVSLARFDVGNIQNVLIISLALSLVPLREFVDPQLAFPAVIFLSNFAFLYYIVRK